MFKKLLSNLSFNPSLINQVAFYAKRVHKEESVRRLGLVFLALAIVVQMFAVVSPPQATLASSNNDLINGGISGISGALTACKNNVANYGDILRYYGISCDDIARATPNVTLHSTDFNRQLYSMGRLQYGKAGEIPVGPINGVTYYFRYLWSWDTAGASTYTALKVTTAQGKVFYILYSCGNLVSVGLPVAPPNLQISKGTIPNFPADGAQVAPGQVIGYRVSFTNPGGPSHHLYIEDPVPANTTWSGWQGSGGADRFAVDSSSFPGHPSTLHAWWLYNQFPAGGGGYVDYTVKINAKVADGTKICNSAFIRSDEFPIKQSNQICMTVKNVPPPPPPPAPTCIYNPSLPADSPNCKPCTASTGQQDLLACLTFDKTAANLTQHVTDANNTTAQPGDHIQYTLSVTNMGKATFKKFVIQDSMSDVFDYAVLDEEHGGAHGGSVDGTGNVVWPAIDIAPGQTIQKQIDVKVKSTIPGTGASSTDPGHFDLVMTNIYGKTIKINVPGPTVKTVAVVTTTLPNTGPGTSTLLAGGLAIIVAYFFARSRLMAKELDIVRQEQVSAGGF